MSFSLSTNYLPTDARMTVSEFLTTDSRHALKFVSKTFGHAILPATPKMPLFPVDKAAKGLSHPDPDSMSIDEVVKMVLAYDKKNWNRNECEERRARYKTLEKLLRRYKAKGLKKADSYEAAGGVAWSMTLEEINFFVQKKFDDLRKKGILLYRSEYEKRENPANFRKLGGFQQRKSGELTRLWGALYLQRRIEKNSLLKQAGYKVPRFIIVIEDHIKTLPVSLYNVGLDSLILRSIETEHGELLVENIKDGIPVARNPDHRVLAKIGFVDYSDPGNILKGRDGNHYIVDTEWKSFEGVLCLKDSLRFGVLRDYAARRFKTFNPGITKEISIHLAPLLKS